MPTYKTGQNAQVGDRVRFKAQGGLCEVGRVILVSEGTTTIGIAIITLTDGCQADVAGGPRGTICILGTKIITLKATEVNKVE